MNTNDHISTSPHTTWPRRILRFALWSLASLITLYAVAYAAINWWGTRRLEQSVARVKDAGESLDFSAMLPKPIDPATNFCAIEPLDGLTAAYETTLSPSPLGERYRAIDASRPKPSGQRKSNKAKPSLGNPVTGRLLSDSAFLTDWSAWFRDSMPTPLAPPSDKEAATIRQGMEAAYPFIKIAAAAALLRKEAQFTPGLGAHGPIVNPGLMRVPHLNPAQMMAQTVNQHLIACIQLRDGAAALADIQAMLRLGKAGVQEPTLIGYLVGMTAFSICSDQLWSCLEARIFNEQQLGTLQREITEFDLTRGILTTYRAEMAGMYLSQRRFDSIGFSCDALSQEMQMQPKQMPGFIRYGLGNLIPHGLLRRRTAISLDENLDALVRPVRDHGLMALFRGINTQPSQSPDLWPSNLIGAITGIVPFSSLAGSSDIARKALALDVVRRQALIACALERFHLQHQSYPEKLEAVVPQYLPTIPTDLIDDKPMRYRRTEDSRFMLWSLGMDGKDDQGKIINPDVTRLSQLSRTEFKGDWPWRYAPEGAAK